MSVLVHEMGHALAIRPLGVQPWITLYGMGGLTSHQGGRFRPPTQILVSLAGPVAGFALAAIVVALIKASGHASEFRLRLALPDRLAIWAGLPTRGCWSFATTCCS